MPTCRSNQRFFIWKFPQLLHLYVFFHIAISALDCFWWELISWLLWRSPTQTPTGIQPVNKLRQCLSVLYLITMLQIFSVLTVRVLSRKQENRGLSSPLWKQELDWLHCICKGWIDFYIKDKKGIALYSFPSIFGGGVEWNIKGENKLQKSFLL